MRGQGWEGGGAKAGGATGGAGMRVAAVGEGREAAGGEGGSSERLGLHSWTVAMVVPKRMAEI